MNPTIQNPVPAGGLPQKMWDQVFDDYTAGRFDLAVLGFQSYIQAYPQDGQGRRSATVCRPLALRAKQVEGGAGRIPESHYRLPAVAVPSRPRITSSDRRSSG